LTPWIWKTDLIVCSQSTKWLAFALRSDGNCVTDLDGFAGDDHAVNKQFQQLSLAAEVRLLQTLPHALAERCGMSCQASSFGLTVGVVHEFAFLAIECDQPPLGVLPAALVLVQRHHAGKVGFCEPLDLLVQARPGAAQVGLPRLHLLRQPKPAASPFHGVHDHLWRDEYLAQVAPDQLLERPAGDAARRAAFARRLERGLRPGPTDVVVVAPPHVPACAGAAAVAAADQAAQKVVMNPVVPRRHPLIIGQPLLRALELFALDNGRHGRDRDPLGRVRHPPAVPATAGRPQGGTPPLNGPGAEAVAEDLTEVDGVGQYPAYGRETPTPETEWRGDAQVVQAPHQLGDRGPLVNKPSEQVTHHHRLRLIQPNPGRIAWSLGVNPVTVGRPRPGQQDAGPQLAQAAAAHPLGDQRPLVLGHRPADLQQQLVVWILAHRPIEELDHRAISLQFFDQQHLMHVVARQPIRRGDQDAVQSGTRGDIAQAVQTRAPEAGAAVAIVAKDVLLHQVPVAGRGVGA
jgi:hypothetical protein